MPGNAMTALASLSLASAQATVTFSSISSAYRDLRLVITPISSGGYGNMNQFAINGATGTGYNFVTLTGNGSAISSVSGVNTYSPDIGLYDANNGNLFIMDFLDSSAVNKHKAVLIRSNSSSQQVGLRFVNYATTSAINSITIKGNTTFAAGSTFTLFGVSA